MSVGSSARIAWFEEQGAQTERNRPAVGPALPAPEGVVATTSRSRASSQASPGSAIGGCRLELDFDLPMPAVSLIEVLPVE